MLSCSNKIKILKVVFKQTTQMIFRFITLLIINSIFIIILTTASLTTLAANIKAWRHSTCLYALASLHLDPDFYFKESSVDYPIGRIGNEQSPPLLIKSMLRQALNFTEPPESIFTKKRGTTREQNVLQLERYLESAMCSALVLVGGLTRTENVDTVVRSIPIQIGRNQVELALLKQLLDEELRIAENRISAIVDRHQQEVIGNANRSSSVNNNSTAKPAYFYLPSPLFVLGKSDWAGAFDWTTEQSNTAQLEMIFNALAPYIPEDQKSIFTSIGCYSVTNSFLEEQQISFDDRGASSTTANMSSSASQQVQITYLSLFTMPFMNGDFVVASSATGNDQQINPYAAKILLWLDQELDRITREGSYAFIIGEHPFGVHAFSFTYTEDQTFEKENFEPRILWEESVAVAFKKVIDKYARSTILGMCFATAYSSHVRFLNMGNNPIVANSTTTSSVLYNKTTTSSSASSDLFKNYSSLIENISEGGGVDSVATADLPPALSLGGIAPLDNNPMIHRIEINLCQDGIVGWQQTALDLTKTYAQKRNQFSVITDNLTFTTESFLQYFVPPGQNLTVSAVAASVNELLFRSQHNNFVKFLSASKGGKQVDPSSVSYLQQRRRLCSFIASAETFNDCAEICYSSFTLGMFLQQTRSATGSSFQGDEARILSKVLNKLKSVTTTTFSVVKTTTRLTSSSNGTNDDDGSNDDEDLSLSRFWPPYFLAQNDMLWSLIRFVVSVTFLGYCIVDYFYLHPRLQAKLLQLVDKITKHVRCEKAKLEKQLAEETKNNNNEKKSQEEQMNLFFSEIEDTVFKFHDEYQNSFRRGAWFRIFEQRLSSSTTTGTDQETKTENKTSVDRRKEFRWAAHISAARSLRNLMWKTFQNEAADPHHPYGGKVEKTAKACLAICERIEQEICGVHPSQLQLAVVGSDRRDDDDEKPSASSSTEQQQKQQPEEEEIQVKATNDEVDQQQSQEETTTTSTTKDSKRVKLEFWQQRPPLLQVFPIQHSVFQQLRELHHIPETARTKLQERQIKSIQNWIRRTEELAELANHQSGNSENNSNNNSNDNRELFWDKLQEYVHIHYMSFLYPSLYDELQRSIETESQSREIIRVLRSTSSAHLRVVDLENYHIAKPKSSYAVVRKIREYQRRFVPPWISLSWFTVWLLIHIFLTIFNLWYLNTFLFEGFQFLWCWNRVLPAASIFSNVIVDLLVLLTGSKPPYLSAAIFANAWSEVTSLRNNALADSFYICFTYLSACVNLILFFSCYSYSRHRTREAASRRYGDLAGSLFLAIFSAGVQVSLADQFGSLINNVIATIQRVISPSAALALPSQIFYVVFLSVTNNALQYAVELDSKDQGRSWVKSVYPFAGFIITFGIAALPNLFLFYFMVFWTLVVVSFSKRSAASVTGDVIAEFFLNKNRRKPAANLKSASANVGESNSDNLTKKELRQQLEVEITSGTLYRFKHNPTHSTSNAFSGSFELDWHGLFSPKFLSPSIQVGFHGIYLLLVLSTFTPDLRKIGLSTMVLLSNFSSFVRDGFVPMLEFGMQKIEEWDKKHHEKSKKKDHVANSNEEINKEPQQQKREEAVETTAATPTSTQ